MGEGTGTRRADDTALLQRIWQTLDIYLNETDPYCAKWQLWDLKDQVEEALDDDRRGKTAGDSVAD